MNLGYLIEWWDVLLLSVIYVGAITFLTLNMFGKAKWLEVRVFTKEGLRIVAGIGTGMFIGLVLLGFAWCPYIQSLW